MMMLKEILIILMDGSSFVCYSSALSYSYRKYMIIRVSAVWIDKTDILLHLGFLLSHHIGLGTSAIRFRHVSLKYINS